MAIANIKPQITLISQGEKVLTTATTTYQLTTNSDLCDFVIVAPPNSHSTVGSVNDGNVLVGFSAVTATNQSGARALMPSNFEGVKIEINNASLLYATGFADGDAVEFQIYKYT